MKDKKSTKKSESQSLKPRASQKKGIKTIEVADKEDIKIVEFNMELLLESLKNCPNLALYPAYLD